MRLRASSRTVWLNLTLSRPAGATAQPPHLPQGAGLPSAPWEGWTGARPSALCSSPPGLGCRDREARAGTVWPVPDAWVFPHRGGFRWQGLLLLW